MHMDPYPLRIFRQNITSQVLIFGLWATTRLSFLTLLFPLMLGLRRAAEYETLLSRPCVSKSR
jgi:hypothetical protein